MNIKIKKLSEHAAIPKYAKDGDSGFDLVTIEDVVIHPGETTKVPTGLAFEVPQGFELQVRPRSGITSKTKLRVQFGTVDSGYRGEVSVTVDNVARNGMDVDYYSTYRCDYEWGAYLIKKGTRIAQGVIAPVIQAYFEESDQLSDSERGEKGFGSTGI
jgi:dUTP pyrophosphatase